MYQTDDVRVKDIQQLLPPIAVMEKYPTTENASETVYHTRTAIERILDSEDDRLLVIAGPCSIHDPKAAIEYAGKIKELRDRAHASTVSAFTLDDICDEWAREFGFECMRRTTLIRFNKFGGNNDYYWQYKGGAENGKQFDAKYNLFAIPNSVVSETIHQNPGF